MEKEGGLSRRRRVCSFAGAASRRREVVGVACLWTRAFTSLRKLSRSFQISPSVNLKGE